MNTQPITVLWIDDDRLLLGVCCDALKRFGYRMLTATEASAGIETAQRERPDVILLDVIMPTMHGLEVCQQLRADPTVGDIPIILLTALEDSGVASMGRKVGATLTMRKPLGPEHIVTAIEQVLQRTRVQ